MCCDVRSPGKVLHPEDVCFPLMLEGPSLVIRLYGHLVLFEVILKNKILYSYESVNREVTSTFRGVVDHLAFSLIEEATDTTHDLEEVVFVTHLEGKNSSLVNTTETSPIKIFQQSRCIMTITIRKLPTSYITHRQLNLASRCVAKFDHHLPARLAY